MKNKVILISIDGMRPDGFLQCGHPFVEQMMQKFSYTLTGSSVMPSVTLPCHTSIFYGVPPMRHGILTNTFSYRPTTDYQTQQTQPIPYFHTQHLCSAGQTGQGNRGGFSQCGKGECGLL